jgi:hypothetical protein
MDYYSDLDLIIVVDPKQWNTVEKTRQQIAESIGPLIIAFTGEHIGLPQMLICLYGAIPLHVDLKFIIPEQLSARSENPVILWDRNGDLHSILASSKASPPAIDWQWIEDRFWVWIHYATSRVGRGELFAAIDFLSFIREKVLGPIALHASSAHPNGVRHIERDASKYAESMQSTLATYKQKDIIRAIQSAISIYQFFRKDIAPRDLVLRSKAEKAADKYLDDTSKRIGTIGAIGVDTCRKPT